MTSQRLAHGHRHHTSLLICHKAVCLLNFKRPLLSEPCSVGAGRSGAQALEVGVSEGSWRRRFGPVRGRQELRRMRSRRLVRRVREVQPCGELVFSRGKYLYQV